MLVKSFRALLYLERREATFLFVVYLLGLGLRLIPRLSVDPHLLTFQGDIWYRLAMAQYILDYHALPEPDLRYRTYGYVPMWYPPLAPVLFALGNLAFGVDLPTLCSRVLPFLEAATPLSIYFLARHLAGRFAAAVATITLALTPSFVFWSGIADPQSFTLFAIPLYILYWMWYANTREILGSRKAIYLVILGVALGINFLLHLSYFLVLLSLLMVSIGLIIKKEAKASLLLDLIAVIAISQAFAAPWWLPRNLYWWWINALVTSSGMYPVERQLEEYGIIAALLGFAGMLYLLLRSPRKHAPLLLWALPIFLETQNEVILNALGRVDLTWHTLAKPLEGFRFYPFLAQPVAIAVGILASDAMRWVTLSRAQGDRAKHWRGARNFVLLALAGLLLAGCYEYGLDSRFLASGLVPEEYQAALWFRDNTGEEAKIIADYYRAQMFAGVTAGRALLGGMFPLRNVDYPYIKAPGQVQNDLYILYNTSSSREAWEIAKRYNATHIFYSRNMEKYGNLLSYFKPATEYGVEVDLEKFEDVSYFIKVYDSNKSGLGEVRIYKVRVYVEP
jgi:hypothetical protein